MEKVKTDISRSPFSNYNYLIKKDKKLRTSKKDDRNILIINFDFIFSMHQNEVTQIMELLCHKKYVHLIGMERNH